MTNDPDIYRGAKLVAARRADQLLDEGDLEGSAIWRWILAAIDKLQRGRRERRAELMSIPPRSIRPLWDRGTGRETRHARRISMSVTQWLKAEVSAKQTLLMLR